MSNVSSTTKSSEIFCASRFRVLVVTKNTFVILLTELTVHVSESYKAGPELYVTGHRIRKYVIFRIEFSFEIRRILVVGCVLRTMWYSHFNIFCDESRTATDSLATR
jgi:hypothetical protein